MWQCFYCGTCHSFGPSLIVIMDDRDQYFEKKSFLCPKIFILPHVKINRWMTINDFSMASQVQL
jgi:hypothetical protein